MQDLLVKLYQIPEYTEDNTKDFKIRRAMAPDREEVVSWVREHTGKSAAGECEKAFSNTPISIFIATIKGEIVGYACYDATAPDFFGPTEVGEKHQGKGIGKALLIRTLWAMKEQGYGYAIIGGAGPVEFYEKAVNAMPIPGSDPGIYKDFLPIIRRYEL